MSSSKKVDLLVRVRYANPLPPPPCPPKLLILPTDLGRFASFSDSAAIARGQPLPMMVDGECGMAVDLLDWTGAWEGDFGELNPTGPPPTLQAADAELLMPPRPDVAVPSAASSSTAGNVAGPPSLAAAANAREPANNWLLNAKGTAGELRASQRSDLGIDHSRDAGGAAAKKKSRLLPTQRRRPEKIDSSAEAQQKLIERSFDDLAHSSVDALKFPGKPHLKVEQTFDILPDPSTWANGYSLFRFQEPPGGDAAADAERTTPDASLASSLWRPLINAEGDNVMVYYVPALGMGERAADAQHQLGPPEEDAIPEPVTFEYVRKYELAASGNRQGTELSLVFREGDEVAGPSGKKRKHGLAGYHEFHSRIVLRKKRRNPHGHDADELVPHWDHINLTLQPAEGEAIEGRESDRAPVEDPTWGSRTLAAQEAAKAEEEGAYMSSATREDGNDHDDGEDKSMVDGEAVAV